MGEGEGELGQDWDITGRNKLEKPPSFRILNTYRLWKNCEFASSTNVCSQTCLVLMYDYIFYVRGAM